MEKITLLAVDIAKQSFQLHGVDKKGKCLMKKKLSRAKFSEFIVNFPTCTIMMEACGGAYHWARKFIGHSHQVKLIAPKYIKPFVKGNKNDCNDAEAIAEAAMRPNMRFVPIKTIEQQDMQVIHRIRENYVTKRTALSNHIRGLLAEYGIVVRQGIAALQANIPGILEDGENELSYLMREELSSLFDELKHLDGKVDDYDRKIQQFYQQHEGCKRIGQIEGVGPITATAILTLGNLLHFKNGRHLAAFIGLVPRQSSTGGKQNLLGISKRGNGYLRRLLIHGARSVLLQIKNKHDPKSLWLKKLVLQLRPRCRIYVREPFLRLFQDLP